MQLLWTPWRTTCDEHGLKAGGVLAAMQEFETLFALKLGQLIFGPAEEVSKSLQGKDTSIQEAVSAVHHWKKILSAAERRYRV